MRIRLPFAGVFTLLLLLSAYAGLSSTQVSLVINDKLLHFLTFFTLTIVFYWVVDTNRRRTLNLTLIVCTACLGIGSEFLQGFLPNGRDFDLYDILANLVGSLSGLGLCSWYHKRMLERKRVRRYTVVPGEDGDEEDLELGESRRLAGDDHEDNGQEEGVIAGSSVPPANAVIAQSKVPAAAPTTLGEEVDNWDENEIDNWDDEDEGGDIGVSHSPPAGSGDNGKKRAD
ncbi:hypothetical protein QBC38DRAFT_485268 [Podospora fimiseda]|uniref:VanZ-like domain-containing protein n=1 Tax=Podospora fimiseda TaxID=252190 RepID=A0AAN7BJT5_9PEZI|nr:hypothetical protein QBC38DRAFT_485268 [Podospora fimiseda]